MVEKELNPVEARVLGVLVEKGFTTPENYPLSLNATVNGANQKSNRDPVMTLMEGEVYAALQTLLRKGFVGASHAAGSRVEKFRHNGQAQLEVSDAQLAVLAELLMRGPQQPGELRQRASRMVSIASLPALGELLTTMIGRGLVRRLPPSPGSRAERYGQLIAPDAHPLGPASTATAGPVTATTTPTAPSLPSPGSPAPALAPTPTSTSAVPAPDPKLAKRVEDLESEVLTLRRQLSHLAWELGKKLEG